MLENISGDDLLLKAVVIILCFLPFLPTLLLVRTKLYKHGRSYYAAVAVSSLNVLLFWSLIKYVLWKANSLGAHFDLFAGLGSRVFNEIFENSWIMGLYALSIAVVTQIAHKKWAARGGEEH